MIPFLCCFCVFMYSRVSFRTNKLTLSTYILHDYQYNWYTNDNAKKAKFLTIAIWFEERRQIFWIVVSPSYFNLWRQAATTHCSFHIAKNKILIITGRIIVISTQYSYHDLDWQFQDMNLSNVDPHAVMSIKTWTT